MPEPFLTDAELAVMCRPLKQPAAQIRYLQRLGVRVRRDLAKDYGGPIDQAERP